MEVHGDQLDRTALLARVGRVEQVAGVTSMVCDEGDGRGVRVLRVTSGGGLDFEVLVDRAFDIGRASFGGVPLAWLSPTGLVGPARYERAGLAWLRGFSGGLLTTCGLQAIGAPSRDGGREWGLHGEVSYRSATGVSWLIDWNVGREAVVLQASVSEVVALGEHLQLDRTYRVPIGGGRIELTDMLTNRGFQPVEFQVLYHVNVGYPLLAQTTTLSFPSGDVVHPFDDAAEAAIAEHTRGAAPEPGWEAQIYRHDLPSDPTGWAHLTVDRPDVGTSGMTLRLSYRSAELPLLWQWRMLRSGNFVMGLEPATGSVAGRAASRDEGLLQSLDPGDTVEFRVNLDAMSSDVRQLGTRVEG